jgi:YHS domain-containing protein
VPRSGWERAGQARSFSLLFQPWRKVRAAQAQRTHPLLRPRGASLTPPVRAAIVIQTSQFRANGDAPIDIRLGLNANQSIRRDIMSSVYTKSALAGALLLGLTTGAYAAADQFKDLCAWGLANHKDVHTNCSVNKTINGKTYCFSSEDARSQFMQNPDANLAKAESFYNSEHKG